MPEDLPIDPAKLQALLTDLQQTSANPWYIFWNTTAPGIPAPIPASKQRTLLAFASPDAALAFAQRNVMSHNGKPPRLRRLSLPQLIQAIVHKPAIETLILANSDQESQRGQLPPGIVLSRSELLKRLDIG